MIDKFQITNPKKQTNYNNQIQNPKHLTAFRLFEYCKLEFVWRLELGICIFLPFRERVRNLFLVDSRFTVKTEPFG
jgi:hypothetical protein